MKKIAARTTPIKTKRSPAALPENKGLAGGFMASFLGLQNLFDAAGHSIFDQLVLSWRFGINFSKYAIISWSGKIKIGTLVVPASRFTHARPGNPNPGRTLDVTA
jgi:hypothetical protein